MRTFSSFACVLLCVTVSAVCPESLRAKPPSVPSKKPSPEPAPSAPPTAAPDNASVPLAHWLLQQNGGQEAISPSLADVIRTATGKNVLPIDAANPADAAVIAKIGNVMDRVLPGMNKPDSPAHVVGRLDEVTAFFEDALQAFAATMPGFSCPPSPAEAKPAMNTAGGFPVVRVLDAASGKSYYLGVALYPTGGREAAVRALHLHPADLATRVTDNGSCLFVAVEYNGKIGREIAFLNWELLDLTKLPLRVVTTFEATQGDVHSPGSVLNDGRKGRD